MTDRIPQEAREFDWASEREFISVHRWSPLRWAVSIGSYFIALTFWIAIALYSIVLPPPQMTLTKAAVVIAVLFAIIHGLFGFVLVQAVWRWRHRTRAAYLFAEGIVYRAAYGEWGGVRWSKVREVWRAETMSHGVMTRSYVRLVLEGETELLLDRALNGYQQLAAEVERRTANGILPDLLVRYAAGERLRFGPVEVDSTVIQWNGSTASWEQVTGFQIADGMLIVLGPPLDIWRGRGVRLRDVPNSAALLALLNLPGWADLKTGPSLR